MSSSSPQQDFDNDSLLPGDIDINIIQDSSLIGQLPDEILSLILQQLPQQSVYTPHNPKSIHECTFVSKRFHAIANPLLWRKPYNYIPTGTDTGRTFDCLAATSPQRRQILGQQFRELHLSSGNWTHAQLESSLPHLSLLQHVTIAPSSHIIDKSFQLIPQHCPLLVSLNLCWSRLSKASFSVLGQHCHLLRELKWDITQTQSPGWLDQLSSCPLESLSITSRFAPLNDHGRATIAQFDQLVCLEITHSHGNLGPAWRRRILHPPPPVPPHVKKSALDVTTATCWPQLTKVLFRPSDDMDDALLTCFITSHPHLEQLTLIQAKDLTDACLDAMAKWLARLTYVEILGDTHFTSQGIRRLICRCLGLNHIRIICKVVDTDLHDLSKNGRDSEVLFLDQGAMDNIRQHTKGNNNERTPGT